MNETIDVISKHKDTTTHGRIAHLLSVLGTWLRPAHAEPDSAVSQAAPDLSLYDETVARRCACRSCGADFTISVGQMNWIAMKGLAPFAHCQPCRTKRRELRRKETA